MGDEGSGRSRVLKQFADSLKGKPGKICILDRAIKNDHQLYTAIADGFGIDLVPGDDAKSIQKKVNAFLEPSMTTHKPLIIALDDVQRCSLAMLEALIELQAKLRQMSLILIGDNSLQKMLQRLQGGKTTANFVLLNALDAREIRQYMNWRLPFQISDIELNNIVNLSRGNLAFLEQEALKKEASHEQNISSRSDGGANFSRRLATRFLLSIIVIITITAAYFLFPEKFSQDRFGDIANKVNDFVPTGLFSHVQELPSLNSVNQPISEPVQQTPVLPVRSNEDWVERQVHFLTEAGQGSSGNSEN